MKMMAWIKFTPSGWCPFINQVMQKDFLCITYFPSLNSGNLSIFKVVTSVVLLYCFFWLALCSTHVGMQLSNCACSSKLRGDPWPGLVS